MKKTGLIIALSLSLFAFTKNYKGSIPYFTLKQDLARYNCTVGEVWNYLSNYGSFGGELSQGWYGMSWPGGAAVNNYYLWESYFTIGFRANGQVFVTHHDYFPGDWQPIQTDPIYQGPGKSAWDIVTAYHDFPSGPNEPGRHSGLYVEVRSLQWPHEPYNDFVAYEIYVTYIKDSSDIPNAPDQLDSLFVSQWYDADVGGSDASNPHIDDLTLFDGWTMGTWKNLQRHPSPLDTLTFYPLWVEAGADGIWDEYVIWGDETGENIYISDSSLLTEYTRNDTTFLIYSFPRGMSLIYDGDDPAVPGDDTGEDGKLLGYLFGGWLYAPPPMIPGVDSIYVAGAETLRFFRPYSHQWWNWESDPATDNDIYNYEWGRHAASKGFRYMPNPYDHGAAEFDYRFFNSAGPYTLADGDTLKFVWVAGVGQGLNGGEDDYWGRGWIAGARHYYERALYAYYSGSKWSDPAHPSDPDEDDHWKIPVPPPSPTLVYSPSPSGFILSWDDAPERTPDPLKGFVDTRGYIIYRAIYQARGWKVLDTVFTGEGIYTLEDTTVAPGFPYYYAVTAFDEDSLESSPGNYLKDAGGNPLPVEWTSEPTKSLDNVMVVPNPYRGSAKWVATEIGDKVMFVNLPQNAVINIYTLSGDHVRTLFNREKKGGVSWNLLNKNEQKVVSGVYIYKVETPNGDYKFGKFMILR